MRHPIRTPKPTPDPNQAAYDAYGSKAAYLVAKAKRDKTVEEADATSVADSQYILGLQNTYKELDFNRLTAKASGDAALATYYSGQMTKVDLQIQVFSAKAYAQDVKALDAKKSFQSVITKAAKKKKGGNETQPPGKTVPGKYYFNAPLVSSGSFLHLTNTQLPKMISAGKYPVGDALNFWTSSAGGKGTIQMDRQTATAKVKAEAKKQAALYKLPFDDKLYGFKFQYNPTTVNMSWSGIMGANPVYEMLNKDPAIPIQTNLFTGTLSFDIILNRIQDMAVLDEFGLKPLNQGNVSDRSTAVNPYTGTVPTEDLQEIFQKGTMYDLEYLFKTLHGWAGYSNNNSTLMGKTHDPGWIPVRPVELHLGNKLRYRVRVSGLEVVHKVFSEKMIPILSVVSITCMRYWDGPTTDPTKDKKK